METKSPVTGYICPSLGHSHMKLTEQRSGRGGRLPTTLVSHVVEKQLRICLKHLPECFRTGVRNMRNKEGDRASHFAAIENLSHTSELPLAPMGTETEADV